eukprot:UN23901
MLERGQKPDHLEWMQNLEKANEKNVSEWVSLPRLSFSRLVQLVVPTTEFYRRRKLWADIVVAAAIRNLELDGDDDVTHTIQQFIHDHASIRDSVLNQLEALRIRSKDPTICQRTTNTLVAALKVLNSRYAKKEDEKEQAPHIKIHTKDLTITSMCKKYAHWASYGPMIARVHKHYKFLHSDLIRRHVLTATFSLKKKKPTDIGEWCTIDSPARIDLAGGWSDTPPVCYT